MNGQRRAFLFILLAALQAGVPLSMIMQRQHTLRDGVPYRFRTAPVDPYDAFRGRYVALGMDVVNVPLADADPDLGRHQPTYASLGVDSNGFARVTKLLARRPDDGDYMRVRVDYVDSASVRIRVPFDRYYMDEHDAPAAERAYWQSNTRTNWNTYVVVRVRAGATAIEELVINDQPVAEYLRQHADAP